VTQVDIFCALVDVLAYTCIYVSCVSVWANADIRSGNVHTFVFSKPAIVSIGSALVDIEAFNQRISGHISIFAFASCVADTFSIETTGWTLRNTAGSIACVSWWTEARERATRIGTNCNWIAGRVCTLIDINANSVNVFITIWTIADVRASNVYTFSNSATDKVTVALVDVKAFLCHWIPSVSTDTFTACCSSRFTIWQ